MMKPLEGSVWKPRADSILVYRSGFGCRRGQRCWREVPGLLSDACSID